jgi:hypothetical protein
MVLFTVDGNVDSGPKTGAPAGAFDDSRCPPDALFVALF